MAVRKKATKKAAKRAASKRKPAKKAKPSKAKGNTKSGSLTLRDTSPGITANDLEKSIAWYTDVVGFAMDERWEEDGKLMGVSLQAGDVTFMIGQDDWKKGRDRKKGEGFRLFCRTTQDIDKLAAKIVAKGGTLDQEPKDQPWGTRELEAALDDDIGDDLLRLV
ncbi:MAG: VOC family protein, partial [Thermoanaerobaculia bacterium]|nr:VOC family protein [Thermoanaerobaculia bacterium]